MCLLTNHHTHKLLLYNDYNIYVYVHTVKGEKLVSGSQKGSSLCAVSWPQERKDMIGSCQAIIYKCYCSLMCIIICSPYVCSGRRCQATSGPELDIWGPNSKCGGHRAAGPPLNLTPAPPCISHGTQNLRKKLHEHSAGG